MNKNNIEKIFEVFKNHNPNPETELKFENEFQLLIAVILSAQSTDKAVNKSTEKLFKIVKKPQDLINLGEDNLKKYIKNIGLFNNKAKNIIETSKILVEKYKEDVPNDREALENLKGVGRKTANIILNNCFNHKTIAVDTHVFRVSKRIGLSKSSNINALEKDLLTKIPAKFLKNAHNWLVLHGRYVCIAKSPKCKICKICDFCDFFKKNILK